MSEINFNAGLSYVIKNFGTIDTNKDNKLSKDEINAAIPKIPVSDEAGKKFLDAIINTPKMYENIKNIETNEIKNPLTSNKNPEEITKADLHTFQRATDGNTTNDKDYNGNAITKDKERELMGYKQTIEESLNEKKVSTTSDINLDNTTKTKALELFHKIAKTNKGEPNGKNNEGRIIPSTGAKNSGSHKLTIIYDNIVKGADPESYGLRNKDQFADLQKTIEEALVITGDYKQGLKAAGFTHDPKFTNNDGDKSVNMDTIKPSDITNSYERHNVLLKSLLKFQERNGIEQNSVFGPQTWSKMSQELYKIGTGQTREIYNRNLNAK